MKILSAIIPYGFIWWDQICPEVFVMGIQWWVAYMAVGRSEGRSYCLGNLRMASEWVCPDLKIIIKRKEKIKKSLKWPRIKENVKRKDYKQTDKNRTEIIQESWSKILSRSCLYSKMISLFQRSWVSYALLKISGF